ncbi:hypothetical protein, partial [Prauserella flavalba]|uniref:hypothetical protein n=1 Tax=Prauserella flavalba TaxID=1477506 RepID=UPI0036EBE392
PLLRSTQQRWPWGLSSKFCADAGDIDLVPLNATSGGARDEAGLAGSANETIRWSTVTEADLGG